MVSDIRSVADIAAYKQHHFSALGYPPSAVEVSDDAFTAIYLELTAVQLINYMPQPAGPLRRIYVYGIRVVTPNG